MKSISAFFAGLFWVNLTQANIVPGTISGTDLWTGKPLQVSLSSGNSGQTGNSAIAGNLNPKATVVLFVSSLCPCSQSHEPAIKKLAAEFPDFQFVAVHSNSNEKVSDAAEYFKKVQFQFPILQDNDQKIADQFGALKTPHVFIVNTKGEIVFTGGVDSEQIHTENAKPFLRNALIAVREGKAPDPSEVRTLGCVIKR